MIKLFSFFKVGTYLSSEIKNLVGKKKPTTGIQKSSVRAKVYSFHVHSIKLGDSMSGILLSVLNLDLNL